MAPGSMCYGGVAQLGEHLLCKQGVIGSNPFTSIRDCVCGLPLCIGRDAGLAGLKTDVEALRYGVLMNAVVDRSVSFCGTGCCSLIGE